MSLSYHIINDRLDLRKLIWEREQAAPEWFKAASSVWHPTFESYCEFWDACEVYGLFRLRTTDNGQRTIEEKFLACVYIEYLAERDINVHISVVEKCEERELVKFFRSLANHKAERGVVSITGWILAKNRPMRRVGEKAGFLPTGLVMSYGEHKDRVLEWVQVSK